MMEKEKQGQFFNQGLVEKLKSRSDWCYLFFRSGS